MQTSAHGIPEGKESRAAPLGGFTLIEVLVVLVIVGIVLGSVSVQLAPDDRSQLQGEADQLALLLDNAGLEARSSGVSMAWSPDGRGYQFWRRNEQGNWKPIEDGPFRFRPWNGETRVIAILVDNEPLKFGERMMLSATSFALPVEIRLERGSARAIVSGSVPGRISAHAEENSHAMPASP